MPLEDPSKLGLTMTGKRSAGGVELLGLLDELPPRRAHAVLAQHELGELLVQGDGQRVGVGAGVGDAQLVEERRVEGLAKPPPPPLGGVEDEVRAVGLEPRDGARGRPGDLDAFQPVAESLDGSGQGVDRLGGVELGFLF